MSEMLSNALGLFPTARSNAKNSENLRNSRPKDTEMLSEDKFYTSNGERIKVDSLGSKNTSKDETNSLPCNPSYFATSEDNRKLKDVIHVTDDSKLLEEGRRDKFELTGVSFKKDLVKEFAQHNIEKCSDHAHSVNENKNCQNTKNKDKIDSEEKIAKKIKQKVKRRARELEALVKKSSKAERKPTETERTPK